MSENSLQLLETLTQADAVPGHEDEVRAIVCDRLDGLGAIERDGMGNVFCTVKGKSDSPRVLLDCHMDEVGFIVQRVTESGFVKFINVGGWWGHVLLGQRVRITTEKGKVEGVIGAPPPHLLGPDAREKVLALSDMFIDIGAESGDQAQDAFGVQPGSPITPWAPWRPLSHPDRFSSKAFDNRVGVALMIEALRGLSDHPNTVIGAACAQEEVGLRGAMVAVETAKPDMAIVLEAPPADDLPQFDADAAQGRLSGGPQIRFFDPTMIAWPKLARWIVRVAEEDQIPHQRAVRTSGGTNAGAIHKSFRGVPTIVIGVPTRYIHSHVSIIDRRDYDATLTLIAAVLDRFDRSALDEIRA